MNKLNLNIEEELNLLEKYNLSITELFFIRILLMTNESYADDYLIRFMKLSNNLRGSILNLIKSLQQKGIILNSYKLPKKGLVLPTLEAVKEFMGSIPLNKTMVKTFHKAAYDLGLELFEKYPMFGNINGYTVSLRGISKKFDSLEDFYRFYGKSIKWNPDTHNKILNLIDWASNNTSYLNMSISTFVIEQKWIELEALKNGDLININYDAIKLI